MRLLKYYIALLFVQLNISVWAQTVVIPDSGFKACLTKKYPTVLDVNQNLIVSQAQAQTGFISCIGYNIKNIDVLEYFTKVSDINLSRNLISEINVWPKNDTLTRLVLDDNLLVTVPSLAPLSELKNLNIRRNKLVSLPNLATNPKITQLYVQGNELTVLPSLSKQKELWAINVSDNKLTTLPILDSVQKLQELVAANNQLKNIVSLTNLKALKLVDISGNEISKLPVLPSSNIIETIVLNKNSFESLPEFGLFPKLKRAYLDDNYLTFSDLTALEKIAGYDTIFPLHSQKIIAVGNEFSVKEKEEKYIFTNTDTSIPGITYNWFFKGNSIQKSTSDKLKVLTDSVPLSGQYYCELTKASFPNLVLKTNLYSATILSCFEPNTFTIEVNPRTCSHNGGRIKITSTVNLPTGFQFELKAVNGSEMLTSTSGIFTNLTSNEYEIFGNLNLCKKQIGNTVYIEDETCENAFITADGDGEDDAYFFSEKGSVSIYDKFGNEIFSKTTPTKWDGKNRNGKVSPGLYYANINNGERLIKITVIF